MFKLLKLSRWPWLTLLWIAAAASVVGMAMVLPVGWDLDVYRQSVKDLREGLDPYVVGPARAMTKNTATGPHYFFVWPPIILKLFKLATSIPALPGLVLYWLIYAAGFGAQLWAGFQLASTAEQRALRYFLPLVTFFPAFMPNEVILCGNLAIPMYGAAMAASIPGWKTNRWGWFYFAVLAGSLIKPPFLVLLAIPLLAGRGQILKSAIVGTLGVALFGVQRFIWPEEFAEYLRIVKLESLMGNSAGHSWSFGFSAAGVLASALQAMGKPYQLPGTIFFLAYWSLLFATLVYFGWRLYSEEGIASDTWMTVLWLGTLLLSPRILQYDAMPATVAMFLLAIRGWKDAVGRWIVIAGLAGAIAALLANQDGLEISLAMWALLIAGILGLRAEAQQVRANHLGPAFQKESVRA
ncbi:MAG: hypothetical protein ABSG70_01845 [Terriglobales bacterium]|jgi:hypothetical protein